MFGTTLLNVHVKWWTGKVILPTICMPLLISTGSITRSSIIATLARLDSPEASCLLMHMSTLLSGSPAIISIRGSVLMLLVICSSVFRRERFIGTGLMITIEGLGR